MAKRVEAALRVESRTIRCGENNTGGADGCADDAGANNSHSNCACRLIACAGHDWGADFQRDGFRTFF